MEKGIGRILDKTGKEELARDVAYEIDTPPEPETIDAGHLRGPGQVAGLSDDLTGRIIGSHKRIGREHTEIILELEDGRRWRCMRSPSGELQGLGPIMPKP